MMGLIILVVLVVYLAISTWVVWGTVRWAKTNHRTPWRWGTLAGLLMYLLVFWDHIPTLVAHKYYCDKYAGLTVNKTVEQWKMENPGGIDNLQAYKAPILVDSPLGKLSKLNDRFGTLFIKENLGYFPVRRQKNMIVDIKTLDVITEDVDFRRGYGSLSQGGEGAWRFWLSSDSCYSESTRHEVNYEMTKIYDALNLRTGRTK